MASTRLCIELASEHPNWDQFDESTKAALAIVQDCLDRRGVKSEFRRIDDDTLAEIVDSWAEIIREIRD